MKWNWSYVKLICDNITISLDSVGTKMYIYTDSVCSHKLRYTLLAHSSYFYLIYAQHWVVTVDRFYNCSVSPYEDGYVLYCIIL